MATVIRLRRLGAKKRPTYRFVATDSRMSRDGRFLEILGQYNPIVKPARVRINEERFTYWLDQGAVPSDTVMNLLKQVGFMKKYETVKKGGDISTLVVAETITERTKKRKKTKGVKETKAEA